MTDDRPKVTIDPRHKSGDPCMGAVPIYLIASDVWRAGVSEAMDMTGRTRPQVLTACWFAGAYGLDGIHGRNGTYHRQGGQWRPRWGWWASTYHMAIAGQRWDDIPDPPSKDAP